MRSLLLGLALALLLLGAPGLVIAEPSIPDAALDGTAHLSASDARRVWRVVMARFYGPYDEEHQCWFDARHNICMKPHKLDVIKQGAHVHYYFVIGNAEYLTPGCHACPGKLGLLVLSNKGGNCV